MIESNDPAELRRQLQNAQNKLKASGRAALRAEVQRLRQAMSAQDDEIQRLRLALQVVATSDGAGPCSRIAADVLAVGLPGPNVADKRHGTVLRDGSA